VLKNADKIRKKRGVELVENSGKQCFENEGGKTFRRKKFANSF
jgi:hypothetical protein